MAKILGIGGVFYKTDDPKAVAEWYQRLFDLSRGDGYDGTEFHWRAADDPADRHMTVFSQFNSSTIYMNPSDSPFMINFITDDLDAMLEKLRADGTEIVGDIVEEEYGRFAWFLDPAGVKMELWEPPARKG